jgi:hypothetical protein
MLKASQFKALQGGTETRAVVQRDVNYFEWYALLASVSTPTPEEIRLAAESLDTEWLPRPHTDSEQQSYALETPRRDAAGAARRVVETLQRPPVRVTLDQLCEAEADSV